MTSAEGVVLLKAADIYKYSNRQQRLFTLTSPELNFTPLPVYYIIACAKASWTPAV